MPALTTEECYAHASRFNGRVALITGAGSGFGRALALKFTALGAKVILGDVDAKGLAETVRLVEASAGKGKAVSGKCDVTSWDDQKALFALGAKTFGNIDIVLPNAGVTELHPFDPSQLTDQDAGPTPPNLTTLNIDLIGVLYTTRLALWYFEYHDKREDPGLRAITLTGSMSSFYGSYGVNYSVAKAGVVGLMKGLIPSANALGIRVNTICPYFSKTAILNDDFVHPHPELGFAKIEDVVAAFVASTSDTNPKSNLSAWLIPDQWGVYRMDARGEFVGAEMARRPKGQNPKNKGGAKL
ncbi:putative oxidoreductase [Vanrija pseudolonga]|uniref:Purtative oxidoreductase n=1 Tax=Vanrija pseudolonga TaxID=143232 RepID=A0AAF0Y2L2_9TREE|nr:purtative oxidoreductase [Vanrija pseudolonga]